MLIIGLIVLFCTLRPLNPAVATTPTDAQAWFDRMSRFIAAAQQFQTTVHMSWDVVQGSGQKIEFSERQKVTIARPAQLRVDILKSSGEAGQVLFDGQKVTAFNTTHEVYAQAEKSGSLDEILVYFVRDLGMRLPLALMFKTSFPEELANRLEELEFVEVSALSEVPCVHLAGRTDQIDFQVWIPETGDPLPRRLTITYRNEQGQPQFRAEFMNWNMSPAVSANDFAFTPPADAERIPFLAEIEKALDTDQKGGD
jgi:hypothetical protein